MIEAKLMISRLGLSSHDTKVARLNANIKITSRGGEELTAGEGDWAYVFV